MKYRWLAVAACTVSVSAASIAAVPANGAGWTAGGKSLTGVYVDSSGFGNTFTFRSRAPTAAEGSLSEVVFAPAIVVRPTERTAAAATAPGGRETASGSDAQASDGDVIEAGTYAPVLAGLGVLGFLAMRRKSI